MRSSNGRLCASIAPYNDLRRENISTSYDISSNFNVSSNSNYRIDGNAYIPIPTEEELMKKILKKLSNVPLIQHKCHSCGAMLEVEENKHIFLCKYCGSTYAFDTKMINDKE